MWPTTMERTWGWNMSNVSNANQGHNSNLSKLITQYMIFSYIVYLVKMEYASKMTMFALKTVEAETCPMPIRDIIRTYRN
jgi:hypothetical protein